MSPVLALRTFLSFRRVPKELQAFAQEVGLTLDWMWEQVRSDLGSLTRITQRGAATVTGTATTGTFTFATAEADTAYTVAVVAVSSSGTPASGSTRVLSLTKATTGVTVTVEVAPGAGNAVTFDVLVARELLQ